MEQGRKAAHVAMLIAVAAIGWAMVLSVVATVGPLPSWSSALVFVVVALGTRALAFSIAGADDEAEMSLDSAFFVAASACLGIRVVAVGVAVIMVLDRAVRSLMRERALGAARRSYARALGDAAYIGGLSGGLLVVWAVVFDIGRGRDLDARTVWLVPAYGMAFLLSHYLLRALELRLAGPRNLGVLIRRSLASVLAESSLLPLAAAIVLFWKPGHPIAFALLGATYLLVNFGFNRVARIASMLQRRVSELEILNRSAHTLGGSLELPRILSALFHETARALPAAFRIEVTFVDDGKVVRQIYERGQGERSELASETVHELRARRDPMLENAVHDLLRPDVRTRLQVPLFSHGECVGILSVESRESEAFGPDELRLLDAIGSQAAAAIENARLYALANVDGLTRLYCRRYLDIRIAEEIERGLRFNTSFALVLLDIDDFKALNDRLGHLAGDRALREISAIAAGQLRGVDLAARYGGEELAFLLPRTTVADAHAVAERIREVIATHAFSEAGTEFKITVSLGVAGWTEGGGGDAQSVIRRADTVLYRAKRAGKNRVDVDLQHFELTPSLAPVRRRARS